MYLTWLDSNSWLIEMGDRRLLVDPWLVGSLIFGQQAWLFKADRPHPRPIPENIDLILLSQGLEDHAHPPTLAALDRHIPVVASPQGAKVVQGLGYEQVISLRPGESWSLDDRLTLQATTGAALGPFVTENGYIITDRHQNIRLYYEPHGYADPALQTQAPVQVVITPVVDLHIPLLGPLIKGKDSALQLVSWLKPQVLLPTAAGGEIQFSGALTALLRSTGSIEDCRHHLSQHHPHTRLLTPPPGDRLKLEVAVLS